MKIIYIALFLALTGCSAISQIKLAGDLRRAQKEEFQRELEIPNTNVVPIKTIGAKLIQLDLALQSVVLGTSNKFEVEKILGKTKVLAFNTNYEVWVYQYAPIETTTALKNASGTNTTNSKQERMTLNLRELKILFNPAGIAVKLKAINT